MRGIGGLGLGLWHRNAPAAPATPPLDGMTVAPAVAYGMRRLFTAYAGPIMRVRETGGNTELDIGFNSDGTLNVAALLAHTGLNDGRVVVWYDQSGNGNNLTVEDGSALRQPRIVSAGVLDLLNGRPSIHYDTIAGVNNSRHLSSVSALAVAAADSCVAYAAAQPTASFVQFRRILSLATNRSVVPDWNNTTSIVLAVHRLAATIAGEFNSLVGSGGSLNNGDRFRVRAMYVRQAGGPYRIRKDAGGTGVFNWALADVAGGFLRVGCGIAASDMEQWSGPFAFALVWSTVPLAGDEAKVAAYLQSEYGVA